MLPLDPEHLDTLDFQLRTKARSLGFGRRLYYAEGQPAVWLKAQILNPSVGSRHAELGWQRELDFYQSHANASELDFLVPHQIIQQPVYIGQDYFEQVLLLIDTPEHFKVRPQQLSQAQIQQHLLQALEPLICLQRLGYLHADLKQEHFVNDQGRVCLLDFEQLQACNQQKVTELHATPRYMAPELFQGQAKTLQSDVYALGVIFYEWLSGQRLEATDYLEWAFLHCQHFIIRLPAQFQAFQGLLDAMLRKQAQFRLADFERVKHYLITEIE